jgi:hypothetical protein
MINVLIDNKDFKTVYGINVLDYSGALGFASERENERVWQDKSGVDRNLSNVRYEAKEFVFDCICKATSLVGAYRLVQTLVDYMFSKPVFVLSLREIGTGYRECFLCQRSSTIVGDVKVRNQNSLYSFKLGFKDINPNALKYFNSISSNTSTINYTKGQKADIYWGDGNRGLVDNSGNYSHTYVAASGEVDIIIDLDKGAVTVIALVADFSGTPLSGNKPLNVQFTDASTGGAVLWSWDFGDGSGSSEQNPLHVYNQAGVYTVSLQIFNTAGGSKTLTKVNYITVSDSGILINGTDSLLINNTDKFIIS